jgi:hypothetical protein
MDPHFLRPQARYRREKEDQRWWKVAVATLRSRHARKSAVAGRRRMGPVYNTIYWLVPQVVQGGKPRPATLLHLLGKEGVGIGKI